MRILFALTYYRPHISGLTIYVQRLAEEMARRRHDVTLLTSQYDSSLPPTEELNGVTIVRCPVSFWISKGAIMPGYISQALRLTRKQDIVVVNLPNTPVELLLPLVARSRRQLPVVGIYHCDLQLPRSFLNSVIDRGVFLNNWCTASLVNQLVAYTESYARSSPLLSRFLGKCSVIPPPIRIAKPSPVEVREFTEQYAPNGEHLIGFAARFATEKGIEFALRALDRLCKEKSLGAVRFLFAGEYRNVLGEEDYWRRMQPLLRKVEDSWTFLGLLESEQMATFYSACDATILPSINCTESFGLVQVESMLCGTPVVASDLPGVCVPVRETGMGKLVAPGDPEALAEALVEVVLNRERYVMPREQVESTYSLSATVEAFEHLFQELRNCRDHGAP